MHDKGFETICIHGGHSEESNRAHITPVYASSTFTFDSTEHAADVFLEKKDGYIYSRWGNPTISEVERKVAMMEAYGIKNSAGEPLLLKALLHSSGMSAITTMLLSNIKAGEKIITHYSLYGGTQELLDKILPDLGIEAVIVDFHNIEAVEETIKADDAISLMYIETPANPTLQCIDLNELSTLGKSYGLTVCADNTFATPYLQQPFKYDVDYVMHSTTKFLNGHGNAIGGIVIGKDIEKMNTIVTKKHRLLGGNSNAFDAFLLNNGLRTFCLRMERHCSNAQKIAEYLNAHEAIEKVNYLGLPSHPDHNTAMGQMKNGGAIMSFELKGGYEAGKEFTDKLKLCVNAVSVGTADTLVSHPASTTHVGVKHKDRIKFGITNGLIRMSVGIETVEDLIADIDQALEGYKSKPIYNGLLL